MKAIVGDIGNTITKVCLIETKKFRVKKIIYFSSIKILSESFLRKKFGKIIKDDYVNKIALFSSVVPKYKSSLKNFLNKFYNVKLKEIKEKNIKKILQYWIKRN